MSQQKKMNQGRALSAWTTWQAAVAMVEEMQSAAHGTDYGISPPRTSPLHDGPTEPIPRPKRGTPEMDEYMTAASSAAQRAERRLTAARQIEAAAREDLLDALDAVAENRAPRFAGDL